MQIICKIDQVACIRLGINAEERESIEINPADLSDREREVLASHFMGGNFKTPGHVWPVVLTPTTMSLKAKLAKMAGTKSPNDVPVQHYGNGTMYVRVVGKHVTILW